MALTIHQQEKMADLISLVLSGHKRIVLKGSAGVGKTFMTNELIYVLKTTLYKYGGVHVTAPTHKALTILETKIEKKPYIHFNTIHSALQLKRAIDKDGKIIFLPSINEKRPPFLGAQVCIVDEASMIGSDIIRYIDDYPDLLFIYIGDDKQLNPVGEINSPVFHKGYPTVELSEIIRQGAGNPIIDLSRNLHLVNSKKDHLIDGLGYLFDNSRPYIIDRLAEVNGTDELKYGAWRNDEVNSINYAVRHLIYSNPRKVEPGESIILNAPFGDLKNNQELHVEEVDETSKTVIVPTSDTVFNSAGGVVEKFDAANQKVKSYDTAELKNYRVTVIDNKGKDFVINALHESEEQRFIRFAQSIKAKCKINQIKWPVYYNFVEQFADFTYNHAVTVHKMQGSTYQKTIINVGNINLDRKNKAEHQRLLYTAVTRAAKQLILYNVR